MVTMQFDSGIIYQKQVQIAKAEVELNRLNTSPYLNYIKKLRIKTWFLNPNLIN